MANKRWGFIGGSDFTETTNLGETDTLGIVQSSVLKAFKLSTLRAWIASKGFGSAVNVLTIASGVVNIDCSLGDYFTLALTANVTSITFSNLPAPGNGRSIAVRMRQDSTGSRTVALPLSLKAITGSDVAVQSTANAYTMLIITSFDQGTRWDYSMKGITA